MHVLVIFDRGAIDSKAYVNPEQWSRILGRVGVTEGQLLSCYYQVVHMVTAAIGAEAHYRLEGERTESLQQAQDRDRATEQAWSGHGCWDKVDNSTNMQGKVDRLIQVCLFVCFDRLQLTI